MNAPSHYWTNHPQPGQFIEEVGGKKRVLSQEVWKSQQRFNYTDIILNFHNPYSSYISFRFNNIKAYSNFVNTYGNIFK